ncbi:MAG: response regulator [Candidatus Omnitrophota bacterium]
MKELIQKFRSCFAPRKMHKVLIIDDSRIDTMLAVKALDGVYHVRTAECGRVGLELAAAENPDIILLDYMMPDLNGPQTCCLLKEDPRTRDIPVIFLTGMDAPRNFVNALEQGAESYIVKPFDGRELREEIAMRIRPCVVNGKER